MTRVGIHEAVWRSYLAGPLTNAQIAEALGVNISSVERARRRLDMPSPHGRGHRRPREPAPRVEIYARPGRSKALPKIVGGFASDAALRLAADRLEWARAHGFAPGELTRRARP